MFTNARNAMNRMTLAAVAFSGSVAMAQPNIEVRINGVIQTLNQEFVFDSTDVGDSTPLIVVVRNVGSQNLEFPSSTPIFLSGGFAGQYALIQPALETGDMLSPNGSTAFRVDFSPTIAKHFMPATVSIPTNDPDSPIFNLNLRGVVPVPQMVISQNGQLIAPQSQVNLAATPVGETSELEVTIANDGERPLELTAPVETFGGFGSGAFSIIQPGADTLQAGESTTFVVLFAPTQTGALTANVGISSNDVGNFSNGRFTFVVRGVGQPGLAETGGNSDEPVADNGDANTDGQQDETLDDGEPIDNAVPDETSEQADSAREDAENADNVEEAVDNLDELLTDDLLAPKGLCGFGAPLGMMCCLASLLSGKASYRRYGR